MEQKLANNINRLLAKAGISGSELSRRIGLPAATVKKIRSGENANPTIATLTPIANFFSITISELIGEKDLEISGSNTKLRHITNVNLKEIPIISWAEAINWPESNIQQHETFFDYYKCSSNIYALNTNEDLWDFFMHGTLIIIEPEIKAQHLDYVIVHKSGTDIPELKQLLIDNGVDYLKPIVKGCQMCTLTTEHKILGVVISAKKIFKK